MSAARPSSDAGTSVAEHVLARTCELAAVPAPPLHEQERAELVARWWRDDGLDPVVRDRVGNVWARLRGGDEPATLVCAHLDTVFDAAVDHRPRREGSRLRGPGVGDDSVAVASLSALDTLLPEDCPGAVWVVVTVGEEGLGNLAGIRAALAEPRHPVAAVVAVEGNHLGRVTTVGVGSTRWRVALDAPGGHAWEAAEVPSAVHLAAALVVDLDALRTELAREHEPARLTLNAGRIEGGEALNARARHASVDLDLRSDDPVALAAMTERARALVEAADDPTQGTAASVEELGSRPAGSIDADHPLVTAATTALRDAGFEPVPWAASTDANAAYEAGVPAITVGVTTGAGEHTLDEWIDVEPIGGGLEVLAATIRAFQEVRA